MGGTSVSYLAIDPGHMNGWATFDAEGNTIMFGQFYMDDMVKFLKDITDEHKLLHIIVEDYVNRAYGNFSQTKGGRNETSKMIGKIEAIGELLSIPVTRQPNTNYHIGAKWGGFVIPKNHSISHQWVAAAHGVYWLQKNGIREPGRAMKGNENV